MRALASSDSRAARAIARRLDRLLRPPKRVGRGRVVDRHTVGLDPHVARFHVELRQRLADAVAWSRRHVRCACRSAVAELSAENTSLRAASTSASSPSISRWADSYASAPAVSAAAAWSRSALAEAGGRTARRERGQRRARAATSSAVDFGDDRRRALLERVNLLAVKRNLLLLAIDGQLAGVRRFARSRGARFGLDELDAQPAQIGLDFRDVCRGRRLSLTRLGQARPRRFNRLGELPILPRKQHFLASPQLVAQPLIAASLGGLPLERSALLLDLEDDVVDARQVLARGLELELGGAPPRLIPGDAGGFLDELTAIGRPRAEDQADLALFDDGVGLRAEPGVHEQLVHVAQPAHLTVDQVFALTRPVQASGHFDFARDRLDELFSFRRG